MTASPAARLARTGARFANARQAQTDAADALYAAIVAACDAGMTETEAARVAGVDRMTIRRARGKR